MKNIKNINDEYLKIISSCKFISKEDEWFVVNTEAKLDISVIYPLYEKDTKFDGVCGLFYGKTMETYIGFEGTLPREDGETCPFDEFDIYDKNGINISKLTIEEYKLILDKFKD